MNGTQIYPHWGNCSRDIFPKIFNHLFFFPIHSNSPEYVQTHLSSVVVHFEKGHLTWYCACKTQLKQLQTPSNAKKSIDIWSMSLDDDIVIIIINIFCAWFISILLCHSSCCSFVRFFSFDTWQKPFIALINHKTKTFSILNRFNASWNQWNACMCHAQWVHREWLVVIIHFVHSSWVKRNHCRMLRHFPRNMHHFWTIINERKQKNTL